MEIPSIVTIFHSNAQFNNKRGTLVAVNDTGFYEITVDFNQRRHTVLLPVTETILIFNEPMPQIVTDVEIER
jgi:hypothetical protein